MAERRFVLEVVEAEVELKALSRHALELVEPRQS
jgi:hypothetical protein